MVLACDWPPVPDQLGPRVGECPHLRAGRSRIYSGATIASLKRRRGKSIERDACEAVAGLCPQRPIQPVLLCPNERPLLAGSVIQPAAPGAKRSVANGRCQATHLVSAMPARS